MIVASVDLHDIPALLQVVLLFGLIFQAAATDLLRRKIFNLPVLIALVGGLVLAYVRGGVGVFTADVLSSEYDQGITLADSVMGLLALFIPFFIAYMTGGMGAGDAKLAAAIGALTGLRFSLWVLFNSAVAGAVLALICLLYSKQMRRGLRRSLRAMVLIKKREKDDEELGAPVTIPYAVAIGAGVLMTVWLFYSNGYALPFMPVG